RRPPPSSAGSTMCLCRTCRITTTERFSKPSCARWTPKPTMPDRLKDKVALIVGAGSIGPGWGNGKATAVAMAREGAKVFCADINLHAAEETARMITDEGGLALPYRADVTKNDDVESMVKACISDFGRIDILDNNVGIADVGGVVELSEESWEKVL